MGQVGLDMCPFLTGGRLAVVTAACWKRMWCQKTGKRMRRQLAPAVEQPVLGGQAALEKGPLSLITPTRLPDTSQRLRKGGTTCPGGLSRISPS